MNDNTKKKNMVLIATLTIVSKIVAVFRQIVLSYCYGANSVSDAYLLAQSIPNILFLLVSSAIGVSFIPIYNKALNQKGEDGAKQFTTRIVYGVVLIAAIIVTLTLLFSQQIIFIFASGFESETALLAAKFLRVSIFSIFFIGIFGVFSAFLKIKHAYFSASVTGIALSIVEIVSCIVAWKYNDVILAIGVTVAAFFQFLIVYLSSIKHGYKRSRIHGIRDEYVKDAILMALPIMIGLGVDEINVIVDKTIASGFSAGSISALNYSNTIVAMVHNVIAVSINTVLFTETAKLAVSNNVKSISEEIHGSIQNALFFLIPATCGLIVFSEPITAALFERGSFTHEATIVTASALRFYAVGLIPNGIRLLSQSYFYSFGKTRFCMIVGIFAVIVNIVLNIVLSNVMGVSGLALATSIAVLVSSCILFVVFCKNTKSFSLKNLMKPVMMLVNALVSVAVSRYVFDIIVVHISIIFAMLVAGLIAVVIYLGLSFVTRTNDNAKLKFLNKGK